MGHIVAMDDSEAQLSLTRFSQKLWGELRWECPDSVEYQQSGTIWLAADDEEMTEVQRKHGCYREHGVASEILDAQALHEAEPNLCKALIGGLLVPGDAVLYPPRAASFLIEKAVEYGAELYIGHRATSIGGGTAALANATCFSAKMIVNAGGQCAARLTPGIEIKARKGHLVITDRYAGKIRHQLVELGYLKSAHSTDADSVAFNLQPRKTGQLLLGSSRQFTDEDGRVNGAILGRMLQNTSPG
jgi:glycine/D-amino acid oxidase-like deaminating enzyme